MKKIPIIVITHGRFGEELIKSAEMIVGPLPHVRSFSLDMGIDPMDLRQEMAAYMGQLKTDPIILTDLFGASPSNIAATFVGRGVRTVVSGVNMPMLIEATTNQEPADTLSERLELVAKDGVLNVGEKLLERERRRNGSQWDQAGASGLPSYPWTGDNQVAQHRCD